MISIKFCFLATAFAVFVVAYGGDYDHYKKYEHGYDKHEKHDKYDSYDKKDHDYGKKDHHYKKDKDDYKKDDYKKDDYKKEEHKKDKDDYGKKEHHDYGKKEHKSYDKKEHGKCDKYTYKCVVEPSFNPKVKVWGSPDQVTCTLPEGKFFGNDFNAVNDAGAPIMGGGDVPKGRTKRSNGWLKYLAATNQAAQDNLRWTMCGDCCKAWMISKGRDPEEVAPIVRKEGRTRSWHEENFKCMCCYRKCKGDKDSKSKKSKKSKSKSSKSSSSSSEGY